MGRTLNGYADDAIADAVLEAAKLSDIKPARWVAQACEERLRREGRLPESQEEHDLLSLVREASAAGVNVGGLIEDALRSQACETEGAA